MDIASSLDLDNHVLGYVDVDKKRAVNLMGSLGHIAITWSGVNVITTTVYSSRKIKVADFSLVAQCDVRALGAIESKRNEKYPHCITYHIVERALGDIPAAAALAMGLSKGPYKGIDMKASGIEHLDEAVAEYLRFMRDL